MNESKLGLDIFDDLGEIVPEFSLENVIRNCHDLLNEISQLEYVCEQLGSKQ